MAFLAASLGATLRFFLPNVLYEPSQKFRAGVVRDYPLGVTIDKPNRVWIVRNDHGLYAMWARCTHLGCTPNYLAAEEKFKCPCHGSGFRLSGINFEGPAPRPLERARIVLADDGQILVDKSAVFQFERGQWTDPEAFLLA